MPTDKFDLVPTPMPSWWLVGPDGEAYGPFRRRQIATRWRRFRMYRRFANGTLRASWEKAGENPFVGKATA